MPAGLDWPYGDAVLLAGAGVPVGPEGVVATVHALLGIDNGAEPRDGRGRPHAPAPAARSAGWGVK